MNVTLWFCGFPNDCHGYFPTQRVAMRWMHAIRKEKFAEFGRVVQDGASISPVTMTLAELCELMNGQSKSGYEPKGFSYAD